MEKCSISIQLAKIKIENVNYSINVQFVMSHLY